MKIREESLETILGLLQEFKEGSMAHVKPLSDGLELKLDQIRIVLKNIQGNNYSVMGVFIKKADNDRSAYNSILARPIADINEEYSKEVESFYEYYIEHNKRSGTRK